MAALLDIGRKRVYYHKILEERDLAVRKEIEDLHQIHPAYGHKRVAIALGIGHNKARRIMLKYGLRPPRRKGRKVYLTRSISHHHYTNLIKNIRAVRPEQIFVSDLTYLKFQGRSIYLATVEDTFTREIVAAGVSDRHDSALALQIIRQAVNPARRPEIFHSDQGSEFMAAIVTQYLEDNGVKISVSDRGAPWQNGYKESFFGRFKEESGDLNRFESLGELVEEIYSQVGYYNNYRIHTAHKMPPVCFRQRFLDADSVSQKTGT